MSPSILSLLLPCVALIACDDDAGVPSGETEATGTSSEGSGDSSPGSSPGITNTTGTTDTATTDATPPGSTTSASSTDSSSDTTASSSDSETGETGETGETSETDSTGETTGSPVNVSEYQEAGPASSLPAPADDASGITWNYDTNRVWIVQNGAGRFYEYAADNFSSPIRSITLGGINGNDTEGLTYLGGGEVAVAFEGGYGVYIADVPDGDASISVPVKQTLTLAPPPPVGNNGLEGITYDPGAEVFYAVGEGQDAAAPRRFFRFARPTVTDEDLDWNDAALTVEEPFIADEALPGSGASLDLAGIAFDARDGNVLIISHTGTRVIQLDPSGDGTILGELMLSPNQWEGVSLVGPNNDLVLIAESNEVQRFTLE
ncbi:MAG: SdiA-regulated domain-containing protein [Nannocystaceae bacterium]|nr:SdiA-regulated domain-containing protein [Nannocystaceae bacterium]